MEAHLIAAARYPVRALLVARAQDWAWSSARAHLAGRGDDGLVRVVPLIEHVGRFADFDRGGDRPRAVRRAARRRKHGPPPGSDDFVAELERLTGRRLQRRKPERKPDARAEQLEFWISEIGKISS